jgi:hypothetical protein
MAVAIGLALKVLTSHTMVSHSPTHSPSYAHAIQPMQQLTLDVVLDVIQRLKVRTLPIHSLDARVAHRCLCPRAPT